MKFLRHLPLSLFILAAPCTGGVLAATGAPEINIVKVYEGVKKYATAARDRPESERADLYDRTVVAPYKDQCYREIEPFSLANRYLTTPGTDLDGLVESVEEMAASNMIARIVEAIERSAEHLPIDHINVCIIPYPPDSRSATWLRERFNGVMGFSEARGIFWITPLPTDGWLNMLPYVAAHEYHHAVAAFTSGRPVQWRMSLLESMLVEGTAEAFAEIVYPELTRKKGEWRDKLTEEQENAIWEEMLPLLDQDDEDLVGKYLFGGRDNIPDAAGYTIGFRIAKSYVELHPEQAVSNWLAQDPRRFVQSSGYRLQISN